MKSILTNLQQLGRALMLPIAVLPVAGLLLRLGQPDVLDLAPIAAAGDAIFSNLGLLFAIGVAVGLARENHGAAGLAAVVGYLVTTKGAEVLIAVPPGALDGLTGQARDLEAAAFKAKELAKLSVPAGIISGVLGGVLYNRYSDIRVPSYLAFFGGRRFVPIASGVAGLVIAGLFGWGWPLLERGMDAMSRSVLGAGDLGLFAYGVLNRALIVTGLHHILNNLAWFLLGDYHGVTGDLKRFFAGDPTAGAFMSGFFPVMMFGLPAACLAMYHEAARGQRAVVGGLLASMALTSFLTGVTEPVEFTFMFLAPALYAVHAVLTGAAMALMHVLNIQLGFSFSAGLFDYVLNFSRATHPLLLLPVGAAYAVIYYVTFRWVIRAFNLKTPGREKDDSLLSSPAVADVPGSAGGEPSTAHAFIAALGGAANLASVDACTTRLRLVVNDQQRVDEAALKRLGARGLVQPSANALQVVLGPIADQVATDIRRGLRRGESTRAAATGAPERSESPDRAGAAEAVANAAPFDSGLARDLLSALGGRRNVSELGASSTRVRVRVIDPSAVDETALRALAVRGIARPSPERVHILIGPAAESALAALRA
ncbi:MAG TPA: N-acetylglucosamine-specific PTS transporter subunit IIBC [Steroidobacteraceae bacterium]|nr:N-acetylglucosamine-specific PTS transporter subunit IIBC [Steroidobacteraceae bacterium]